MDKSEFIWNKPAEVKVKPKKIVPKPKLKEVVEADVKKLRFLPSQEEAKSIINNVINIELDKVRDKEVKPKDMDNWEDFWGDELKKHLK